MRKEEFEILQVTRMIEEDPLWLACCSRLFDLANKWGLEGKKLSDLRFALAKSPAILSAFSAKLEMTDEEWETRQKAFNKLLDKTKEKKEKL